MKSRNRRFRVRGGRGHSPGHVESSPAAKFGGGDAWRPKLGLNVPCTPPCADLRENGRGASARENDGLPGVWGLRQGSCAPLRANPATSAGRRRRHGLLARTPLEPLWRAVKRCAQLMPCTLHDQAGSRKTARRVRPSKEDSASTQMSCARTMGEREGANSRSAVLCEGSREGRSGARAPRCGRLWRACRCGTMRYIIVKELVLIGCANAAHTSRERSFRRHHLRHHRWRMQSCAGARRER